MINKIKEILNNYKVKIINIKNTKHLCFLNKNVDKIYIINLKTDNARRNYIYLLMKKYKINYTLIVVEKIDNKLNLYLNKENYITKGELGCLLSHLWCLNNAIQNQYNNFIIFEDDIIFHKDFNNLFEKIYSPKLDFLLLGACDFSFSSLNQFNVKDNLYTIDNNAIKVYGAHANYYSLLGATKMFEFQMKYLSYKITSFFDKNYKDMFNFFKNKNSAFICYPNLVVSDISTTNLHHSFPFFSVAENNYYSKCFTNFNFTDYHFIYLSLFTTPCPNNISLTYEEYISKLLYNYLYKKEEIIQIKKRLDFDFFTIEDIKIITFNI
jgi:GR25 family glycosyltransferase involved in LPS biosynthesis